MSRRLRDIVMGHRAKMLARLALREHCGDGLRRVILAVPLDHGPREHPREPPPNLASGFTLGVPDRRQHSQHVRRGDVSDSFLLQRSGVIPNAGAPLRLRLRVAPVRPFHRNNPFPRVGEDGNAAGPRVDALLYQPGIVQRRRPGVR